MTLSELVDSKFDATAAQAWWSDVKEKVSQLDHCPSCGRSEPVVIPQVPWGDLKCKTCRTADGKCRLCNQNRNDCCC